MKYFLLIILFSISLSCSSQETADNPYNFDKSVEDCLSQDFIVGQETFAEHESRCVSKAVEPVKREMDDLVQQIKESFKTRIKKADTKKQARQLRKWSREFDTYQRQFEQWVTSFNKKECRLFGSRMYSYCYNGKVQEMYRMRIRHLKFWLRNF